MDHGGYQDQGLKSLAEPKFWSRLTRDIVINIVLVSVVCWRRRRKVRRNNTSVDIKGNGRRGGDKKLLVPARVLRDFKTKEELAHGGRRRSQHMCLQDSSSKDCNTIPTMLT